MNPGIGDWMRLADSGQPCRVVDQQELWGTVAFHVWLPMQDIVLRLPADRLISLDGPDDAAPHHLTYAAAATRIADALERDVLVAPLEGTVIPLPHQIGALSLSHDAALAGPGPSHNERIMSSFRRDWLACSAPSPELGASRARVTPEANHYTNPSGPTGVSPSRTS